MAEGLVADSNELRHRSKQVRRLVWTAGLTWITSLSELVAFTIISARFRGDNLYVQSLLLVRLV